MGYVIKINDYEYLLEDVRPYVVNTKSNLLYINDQLEAQVNYNQGSFELNHRSPSVKNEQGSNSESLYIINESLDDGGNIMETLHGEENSEKYRNSLAGNGKLYECFPRIANAIRFIVNENLIDTEDEHLIGLNYPNLIDSNYAELINSNDVNKMKIFLQNLLQGITHHGIRIEGGGKPKKAKKTKKKRKQKKHTKKLKYRKKSTKSTRKTEKKRK